MSRRCLMCARLNPCPDHPADVQAAELRRNDEAVAAIRATEPLSTLWVPTHEEIGRLTLCGSTRFRDEYELWNKRLTLAGFLVYSVSGFGHSGDSFTDEEKARLDQIHLAKIDASHAIVVINPGGYIGDSTRREIEHARATGKTVYLTDGVPTVYQLRTGPLGHRSLRYRAFAYGDADGLLPGQDGPVGAPGMTPSLTKEPGR